MKTVHIFPSPICSFLYRIIYCNQKLVTSDKIFKNLHLVFVFSLYANPSASLVTHSLTLHSPRDTFRYSAFIMCPIPLLCIHHVPHSVTLHSSCAQFRYSAFIMCPIPLLCIHHVPHSVTLHSSCAPFRYSAFITK